MAGMPKRTTPAKPRWLTKAEMAAWTELLGVVIWLPPALDAQLQRDSGLSHFEYQILAMLSQDDGRPCEMGDLSVRTNASPSRVSHAVGRLEKQDWVRRSANPGNRRIVHAALTDAGRAKVVESAPGHVSTVRQYVFDLLSAEQVRQLTEIARVIREAASRYRDVSAPAD
jgi:DNA-binding MarR family transcriptional regulator